MKHRHAIPMCLAMLVMPAAAEIWYSGLLNPETHAIPLDFTGVTVTIDGGTLNPFFGGAGVANNDLLQPGRTGTGNLDTILNFAAGSTVGSGLNFGTGFGGSQTHLGTTFTAGQEGYLGFKLNGANYGWIRVVFTANEPGGVVKDWAYDNSGANITVGGIQQSSVIGSAQTVTLSPASGESLTLGSAITNSDGNVNSLVKSGTGTATLSGTHTYTGTTAVTGGTLEIAAGGSINDSASLTVAAGAGLVYNSSTALTLAPALQGNGASNRATLGGTGPIAAAITLDNLGDVLAPGNSPGIQEYTTSQSWDSFSYEWETNNFTGTTPGTHFDQIAITGSLHLSGGGYILDVLSLTAEDAGGDVPDFSEINRSWNLITTTEGITGFEPADWTIHTDGFTNPHTGTWSLGQAGNNLVLHYNVIPEPGSALPGALALLLLMRRRRIPA